MVQELIYGTRLIQYTLLVESRRTLRIEVHPDGTVWVKVPEGTEQTLIDNRLLRRASWIAKQQRYFQTLQSQTSPKQYVSGESFRYLGYQHRLKVDQGEAEMVKRIGSRLWVQIRPGSPEGRVEQLVTAWYRRQAERVFADRLAVCQLRFAGHVPSGFESVRLSQRRMAGRWGSCTAGGQIYLNPALIQAATDCIDYVITHELAHLVQHNHSPAFYRLLSAVMPDWQARKQKLAQSRWD